MSTRIVAIVLGLGLESAALAQQTPNAAPAFRAEGVYDLGAIDQVSVFNGALSAQIQLAEIRSGGNLSVPLLLTHSSSGWEAFPNSCPDPDPGICGATLYPKPQTNAGVGWRISLGQLFQPVAGNPHHVHRWVYADSAGSEHTLFPELHQDDPDALDGDPLPSQLFEEHMYSRDASFVRVVCNDPNPLVNDACEVHHPNGEVQRFENFAAPAGADYRLTSIADPFGNSIDVAYNVDNTRWEITDSDSTGANRRTTIVQFLIPAQHAEDQPRLVDYVDVPCFVPSGASTCPESASKHARWELNYALDSVYPPSVYQQSPIQRPVWLLSAVAPPAGNPYLLPVLTGPGTDLTTAYHRGFGGALQNLTLPTLGRLRWLWDTFDFPSIQETGPCPQELPPNAFYWNTVFAVTERTQFDHGGIERGTWRYDRRICPGEVADPEHCAEGIGTGERLTVTIESPLHDLSEHFFSVYPAEPGAQCEPVTDPVWGTGIWEYGLPYTRSVTDAQVDGADTVDRFLSSRVWDCPEEENPELEECELVRSVFQTFELDNPDGSVAWDDGGLTDRNRRLLSERTVFHDDGERWKLRTMADNDGYGHYRETTARGWLLTENSERFERTTFNFGRGTYNGLDNPGFVPRGPAEPWLPDLYRSRAAAATTVALPSGTVTQLAAEEFCFDETTGFLNRHRRRSSEGDVRSTNDVLLVRTPDGEGNLLRERWFGADGQAISTLADCDFALPSSDLYRVDYTYTGTPTDPTEVRTSQWKTSTGGTTGALGFFTSDVTIDRNSGLARSTRDVAGLETTYDFDLLGRLESIQPSAASQAAWEQFVYQPAAGDFARVTRTAYENGGFSSLLRQERWRFDGLGRIRREERLALDGLFHERYSFYDDAGNRNYLSEWGRGATAAPFGLEWSDFDPFGRPRVVSRFANDILLRTEFEAEYAGERQVRRKSWIATSAPGGVPTEEPVVRTEISDIFGRLRSVEEPSDAGAAVSTAYEYDVGNRLRRARTPRASGGTQDRWWIFDQRGFLTQERSPEKGASGNGDVTYTGFDPLGNATSRTDAGLTLSHTFDRAGRLLTVREPASSDRLWKNFVYTDANFAGNWSRGKLSMATGYNWLTVTGPPDVPYEARFVEAFQYGGPGGRRTNHSVTFWLGVNGMPATAREAFVHAEQFNDAGERTLVDYPVCVQGMFNCPNPTAPRTVEAEYFRGFLIGVLENGPGFDWMHSATYHHSGLWASISRGNGVVETQALDALKIARPASIEAKLGSTSLWRSGAMSYDRSGNLTRLENGEEGGTDLFTYDKVGRLASASVWVPADRGELLLADGFESGSTTRWYALWPPAGWSSGQKQQTFSFDRFGNFLDDDPGSPPGDPDDWPTSDATNRMDGTIATYDARGNLIALGGAQNTFDALNRQTKHLSPDGSAEYYMYTADDERILTYALDGGSAFRWTLRDFGGKVLRRFHSRALPVPEVFPVRDYIHAGDRVLGTEDPMNPGASRMYATVDHLGTPRLWADEAGIALRKHKYYPFGEEATPSDQWNVALQFTGHERDNHDLTQAADDGDHMHARNASPQAGRMLSVDPVMTIRRSMKQPQGWNRYSYVQNSPLMKIDPDGRLAIQWHYVLTYKAARNLGMGRLESMALAWKVLNVDRRDGSQGKDAESSNLHAMRGMTEDGRTQTIKEGRAGTEASIKKSLTSSDLAAAIHTAQDLAAPEHADRVWNGFGVNPTSAIHLRRDMHPDAPTIRMAFDNTTSVLEAYAAGNTSPIVSSGSAVDDQP